MGGGGVEQDWRKMKSFAFDRLRWKCLLSIQMEASEQRTSESGIQELVLGQAQHLGFMSG